MPDEKKTTYTPAQKKAIQEYMKGQAEIKVRMPKERIGIYRDAAAKAGLSLNQFAISAMDDKIRREQSAPE